MNKKLLLIILLIGTVSLLFANNDNINDKFPKKVYRDYIHSLPLRYKYRMFLIFKNSSTETRDSVINFINNVRNNQIEKIDTIYICTSECDFLYYIYSVINKDEILILFPGSKDGYHECIKHIESGTATNHYSSWYLSLLRDWRTDILEDNYITNHFSPITSCNIVIRRFIYKNKKLIHLDVIDHIEFKEMYNKR